MRYGTGKLQAIFKIGCLAAIAILFLSTSAMAMQDSDQEVIPPPRPSPWEQELAKYPGLLPELGRTMQRIMKAAEFPAPRSQSRLLPLMPDSAVIFAATPNYGNTVHQALLAFQQELKESEVLRNWWQHSQMNSGKPTLEEALAKFYEFSQYLGDEVVVSGDVGGKQDNILFVAAIAKPGLKLFLQQLGQQFGDKSGAPWRVFDPQQLAQAKGGSGSKPLVLLRPDLIVVSSDLEALRKFDAALSQKAGKLDGSPFGQRLLQSYQRGGASVLGGLDLQKMMGRMPHQSESDQRSLHSSGFDDVRFLVWEHKDVPGEPSSEVELSFNGKRRGIASWLATPAKLGSLDFVAPDATLAVSILLKDPAQILDDFAAFNGPGGPLSAIDSMQEQFKINVRNDVLRQLTGEITLELDGSFIPTPGEVAQEPLWKIMLGVRDAEGLQKTFDRLATVLNSMSPDGQGPTLKRREAGRLPYYSLSIPSPQKTMEIDLAFSDGYMLAASTRARLSEAVRLHRDGESLARSGGFHAALPVGRSADASALLYQNYGPLMGTFMSRISPELASLATESSAGQPSAAIAAVYADETTIRESAGSSGFDVGLLIGAAIAIPNLMRARISANETTGATVVRILITNQIAYATTYPDQGYARDLASMGPGAGPAGDCTSKASAKHACLIDGVLGNASCTGETWCTRDSYRYLVKAICGKGPCSDFVVVATPQDSNAGHKNFCATSDGVPRFRVGPPLTSSISAAECMKWEPL